MSFNRNSDGFRVGQAIIGKHDTPLPKPQSNNQGDIDHTRVTNINLEKADNGGFTVSHTLKDGPKDKGKGEVPYDYDSRHKKHVFGDAKSAHAHLAKLMGCE